MPSQTNSHLVSVIVPAYRQEKTIVQNIKQFISVLDTIRYDYEIIIVIDGQVDNTLNLLRKEKLSKTIVISYEENRGKAFAIRMGMNRAKGDYVMFIDSGFEIDPNGISMLIEHMEWYNADIIVGSKRHPASYVSYTWQRRILSYGYYFFVKLLFGINVRDTQAGIKIFRKKVLSSILPRLLEKRFAGDLEMLVVAKQLGFQRIFEAPIKLDYQFSDLTSAATVRSISMIFVDTIAIFYRAKILRYYKSTHHRLVEPQDIKQYKFLR